jgi:uncharacterized protein (TIGR00725 family)
VLSRAELSDLVYSFDNRLYVCNVVSSTPDSSFALSFDGDLFSFTFTKMTVNVCRLTIECRLENGSARASQFIAYWRDKFLPRLQSFFVTRLIERGDLSNVQQHRPSLKKDVHVAVIVATKSRPSLLQRAIQSIFDQTRLPDTLVIVDDSRCNIDCETNRSLIQSLAAQRDCSQSEVVYLRNKRTPGACGAWNTGLLHISRCLSMEFTEVSADDCSPYIAILDDDDYWEVTHLEACIGTLQARSFVPDMVISGIRRLDASGKIIDHSIAEEISVDDLLVRNPHVQGSNLFVRLQRLLQAGLFDEAMRSCTDRDILIRLLSLPQFTYQAVDPRVWTVVHDASNDRPRLSSRGSAAKLEGLSYFYYKYQSWMSKDVHDQFLQRSLQLFDWQPEVMHKVADPATTYTLPPAPDSPIVSGVPVETGDTTVIPLVVGIISDSSSDQISGLLSDLSNLRITHMETISLWVLVLRNGVGDVDMLGSIVQQYASKGLRCHIIDTSDVNVWSSIDWCFPKPVSGRPPRLSIAEARSHLQLSVGTFCQYIKHSTALDAVAWILDDDKRIPAQTQSDFWTVIRDLRRNDIDVAIGPVEGAPQVPSLSLLRVLLVDVFFNLRQFSTLDKVSSADVGNMRRWCTSALKDSHYDLSLTNFCHLECPRFSVEASDMIAAFSRMADVVEASLLGQSTLRPVCVADQEDSISDDNWYEESYLRGGNTLILNTRSLLIVPNVGVQLLSNAISRRSDMLWALFSHRLLSLKVVRLKRRLIVFHDRSLSSHDPLPSIDGEFRKLSSDMFGHALVQFCDVSSSTDSVTVFDFLLKKVTLFDASVARISGLCQSILGLIQSMSWHVENSCSRLWSSLQTIQRFLSMWKHHRHVLLTDALSFESEHGGHVFVSWVENVVKNGRLSLDAIFQSGLQWCSSVRTFCAKSVLVAHGQLKTEDELIGVGGEGVVFQHAGEIVKYLDFLRVRGGSLPDMDDGRCASQLVVPVLSRSDCFGELVYTSPFISGQQYDGGHGGPLVRLMQEFLLLGLASSNFSCENVVYQPEEDHLYYVDIGMDLRPISSQSFLLMAARAYVCWRWAHRTDLKELLTMTNCLRMNICKHCGGMLVLEHSDNLPELQGFSRFLWAIFAGRSDAEYVDVLLAHRIAGNEGVLCQRLDCYSLENLSVFAGSHGGLLYCKGFCVPSDLDASTSAVNKLGKLDIIKGCRILDFGCGKGRLLHLLDHLDPGCAYGYDPDGNGMLATAWNAADTSLRKRLTSQISDLKSWGKFDVVCCVRVLCTIDNLRELRDALQHIRGLSHAEGRVILAVCHPAFLAYCPTVDGRQHDGFGRRRVLKKGEVTGRVRTDCMTPPHILQMLMFEAGLLVTSTLVKPAVCTIRFEVCPHWLIFEARPIVHPLQLLRLVPRFEVALLIRCCGMDASTLHFQVPHLVRQFRKAAGDCAVISAVFLLVDTLNRNAPRKHCDFDMETLRKAAENLSLSGWVDRIIQVPDTSETSQMERISSENCRWFGVENNCSTHAANGVPVINSIQGLQCAFDAGFAYALHVDVDVLVYCADEAVGSLGNCLRQFQFHPSVVTVAVPILYSQSRPFSSFDCNGVPWRTEVRCSLFALSRLMALLPLHVPSDMLDPQDRSRLAVGWYRVLDANLAFENGPRSLRGGSQGFGFLHPQNHWKSDDDPTRLGILTDLVERGSSIPSRQFDSVDIIGDGRLDMWLPVRSEKVIFVICGRNVPLSRMERCISSLVWQENAIDWGAVVIDDASDDFMSSGPFMLAELLHHHEWTPKFSFLCPRMRRGMLANIDLVIRKMVSNPDAIIVTVDLDDCLLGNQVLVTIRREFLDERKDLVLASMLRTDKKSRAACNPQVTFDNCRQLRAIGNVWRHLRCFRRNLFCQIPPDYLQHAGRYFSIHTDWAYMACIAELARFPVALNDSCLYLYEPGTDRSDPAFATARQVAAHAIVSKPPLKRRSPTVAIVGDANCTRLPHGDQLVHAAESLGRAFAKAGYCVITGGLGGVMEAAARGASSVSTGVSAAAVIGLAPGDLASSANVFQSVVLPTGLGHARNAVVGHCDVVIGVGGGAGTLSELCVGWGLHRLVMIMHPSFGSTSAFADRPIDTRVRMPKGLLPPDTGDDRLFAVSSAQEALDLADRLLPIYLARASSGIPSHRRGNV